MMCLDLSTRCQRECRDLETHTSFTNMFGPPEIVVHRTQQLDHVDQALLGIIRTNSASQFAQHAPELPQFREAIIQCEDDIESLSSFQEFILLTDSESYRPVAKFFATPCR